MTIDNFTPTPDFQGCGCKICRAGLGEQINWLATRGSEVEELQEYLKANGLEVSKKMIKKHLDAFDLKPGNPELSSPEIEELLPTLEAVDEVEVLNSIDFSQYSFEENNPESTIAYLQKIALKIHLGVSAIAMRDIAFAQASGGNLEVYPIANFVKTQKALSDITAIEMVVNQQKAIRTVESLGLKIDNSDSLLPPANLPSRIENNDVEDEQKERDE